MAVGTLQKARKEVAPFEDDFNDGNYTGWSVFGGTWSASIYYARNTSGGTDRLVKAFAEPDYAMSFSYYREDSSNEILLYFRAGGGSGGTLRLDLTGTYARIVDSASSPTQLAYSSAHGSATGTWYDGYVEVDGANVKVMLGEQGEMLEQVFNVATATTTDTARLEIRSQNGAARFDNIRILGDGLTQTTTFAVNNANEMTSMTDVNGATTFAYDGWGRMESKSRGSFAAEYGFRYGHFLASYDTNFPDEGDVEYVTGGNAKRRVRTAGMDVTGYRWAGMMVTNEEQSGSLVTTFVGKNTGQIDGANAATGVLSNSLLDRHGSTRRVFDVSKSEIATQDFDPYGVNLRGIESSSARGYTGFEFDVELGGYFAPYRYFSPKLARWEKRDPAGSKDGFNLYQYVRGNPVTYIDPLGLWTAATTPELELPDRAGLPPLPPGESYSCNMATANDMTGWSPPIYYLWFAKQTMPGGPWDYKQYDPMYEDGGNFNFGATCCALGMPLMMCLQKAGMIQQLCGTSKPEWGGPTTGPPYGDDPYDQEMIRRGYEWCQKQGCP